MSARAAVEAWLNRLWYPTDGEQPRGARAMRLMLTPLAWLFALAVAVRRAAYRRGLVRPAPVARPVVVIGNITVGGTGKTPMTAYLAETLLAAGIRVGIVSRGYGARRTREAIRVSPRSDPAEVGDEPLLLATRLACPVVVGRDRPAAARLIEDEVEVILADDGLQHLALPRDLEIALIDRDRGLGNGRLLPCGPLREPAERLQHVDFVVLTGAAGSGEGERRAAVAAGGRGALPPGIATRVPVLQAFGSPAAVVSLATGEARSLASFAGREVHAVAGIADPSRFFDLLRAGGVRPREHPLRDHAEIDQEVLAFADDLPVLMTDKDAVKCRHLAAGHHWVVHLRIALEQPGRERLLAAITRLVHRRRKTES